MSARQATRLLKVDNYKTMQRKWVYTGIIIFLLSILVLGIPLFPKFMAIEILGPLNLGMSVFLLLHILTPVLAFRHLQKLREEKI